MKKYFLAFPLFAMLSMPVMASGLFVSGKFGQSQYNFEKDFDYSTDDTDNAFSIGAGYRFNKYIAVEASYHDFGEMTESYSYIYNNGDYEKEVYTTGATALQLSMMAAIPLGESASIYGRLGLADIDFKGDYSYYEEFNGDIYEESESGEESTSKSLFGIGFSYAFTTNLGLCVEYSEYAEWEDLSITVTSVGLTYQF